MTIRLTLGNKQRDLPQDNTLISSPKARQATRLNSKRLVNIGKAAEPIEAGGCISITANKCFVCSSLIPNSTFTGISIDKYTTGENIIYQTSGYISSTNYNFTAPAGSPVWVGANGLPTDTIPSRSAYHHKIGVVVSSNTLLLQPDNKININE